MRIGTLLDGDQPQEAAAGIRASMLLFVKNCTYTFGCLFHYADFYADEPARASSQSVLVSVCLFVNKQTIFAVLRFLSRLSRFAVAMLGLQSKQLM